ncbi:MAG TPA: nucleotidyltransferase family protein [Balneolales bacterium]|nr:nucleotidyltransferase family protein [Balneolales bacterium]
MNRECIILAGGLGTRLRSELPDTPKVMAPVAGRPFLYYVLKWLGKNNATRIILSLGYKSEVVIDWCSTFENEKELVYSIESEPLGTGGAITQAIQKAVNDEVFIVNGDTLFNVDLDSMMSSHQNYDAELTLALKPMEYFDRYGTVIIDESMKVRGFEEKGPHNEGLINGGVYLINRDCFNGLRLPEKFSFETNFLESYFNQISMYGFVQDTYFIDIGIPDDYRRAQKELKNIYPNSRS